MWPHVSKSGHCVYGDRYRSVAVVTGHARVRKTSPDSSNVPDKSANIQRSITTGFNDLSREIRSRDVYNAVVNRTSRERTRCLRPDAKGHRIYFQCRFLSYRLDVSRETCKRRACWFTERHHTYTYIYIYMFRIIYVR